MTIKITARQRDQILKRKAIAENLTAAYQHAQAAAANAQDALNDALESTLPDGSKLGDFTGYEIQATADGIELFLKETDAKT